MPNDPFARYLGADYGKYKAASDPYAGMPGRSTRETRYPSAIDYRDASGNYLYDPSLFNLGEDANKAISIFASIFGDPSRYMGQINRAYDTAAGNLGQRGETARGQAQTQAGGQAYSRGLLNPSSFISSAGAKAYNPFVQALGGLETQRAGALSEAEENFRRMLFQTVMNAYQGQQQRDYTEEQNKFNWSDILSLMTNAAATYAGASAGASAAAAASDRRLKKNISRIGTLDSGLGVYKFDYVWGGGKWVGVMADEVENIFPEAVIVHPSGYKMVNYSMLR